ncbi:MAG: hypothetical protein EA349_12265, partial [Halomonadaceae bacterium]
MTPTVAEALLQGVQQLSARAVTSPGGADPDAGPGQTDSPELDAQLLLCAVVERPRVWLYTWPEKPLTATQWQRFQDLLAQRLAGAPVAYLLGEREFWSLPLRVNHHTLIPRPDTEQLVE